MGKKLAPLRKIFAEKSSKGTDSGNQGEAAVKKRGTDASSAPSKKKAKRGQEENDDDVDWEKLEKEQNGSGSDSGSGEDDDSDDDEGSEEGDGIGLEGNLEHVVEDYTFEFNDMRDEYSEGICTMLRKIVANPTEAYNLATVVTSQTLVGTVVNCEGGQDSFAFATVLPLKKVETVSAVKGIIDSLTSSLDSLLRTAPNDEVQLLKECLALEKATSSTASGAPSSTSTKPAKGQQQQQQQAARTGLLLHKRFTNLPIQLVGALHRNLEEDMSWAQQQATDEDESAQENAVTSGSSSAGKNTAQKGNFFAEVRNLVLFCECTVSKEGRSTYALSEGSASSAGTCYNVLGSCSDVVFANFEDEVYLQHASAAVLWRPPRSLCNTDLIALLVPVSKLKKCANGICELIPE